MKYTVVCTRCTSTWWLPNDVEMIDKVDRFKSIMLGVYREQLALVTVQLDFYGMSSLFAVSS